MDGTSTNFSAMRKFGCQFTGGIEKMTGKFNYGKYNPYELAGRALAEGTSVNSFTFNGISEKIRP